MCIAITHRALSRKTFTDSALKSKISGIFSMFRMLKALILKSNRTSESMQAQLTEALFMLRLLIFKFKNVDRDN